MGILKSRVIARKSEPRAIIVMGVMACGKTTVGTALAEALGCVFVEGDDFHPPANVAKMTSSIPLIDEDRWPWLKAIAAEINSRNGTVVASCSALKYAYRARLRESINKSVSFVWLNISRSVLEQRLSARKGHFMPTELLDSQLQALEPPGATEEAIVIDDPDTAQVVCTLLSRIKG